MCLYGNEDFQFKHFDTFPIFLMKKNVKNDLSYERDKYYENTLLFNYLCMCKEDPEK